MPVYTALRLFDPGPARTLSWSRRRTERRRQLLEAGTHPATLLDLREPAGETCRSCVRLVRDGHGYHCASTRTISATGTASEVRLWWPACQAWEQG